MNNDLLILLMKVPGIIIATTFHEFAKAVVATILGNNMPKSEGRLTLNPLSHFEPIGFILMLQTGFGWGKPVELGTGLMRSNKNDNLLIYTSGIFTNIIVAYLLCIVFNLYSAEFNDYLLFMFTSAIYSNVSLAVFNIIPVYPLAGSKILSALSSSGDYFKMLQSEKILQMLLVFLLLMGVVGSMLNPIISMIINLFGMKAF